MTAGGVYEDDPPRGPLPWLVPQQPDALVPQIRDGCVYLVYLDTDVVVTVFGDEPIIGRNFTNRPFHSHLSARRALDPRALSPILLSLPP